MEYTKLSNLIDDSFTIEKVHGYCFKRWDNDSKKMIVEQQWHASMKGENFRKVYQVETDKGKLDLGSGQLGNLLELVMDKGVADLRHKTFKVSSNGKTGMDVRYYFKVDYDAKPKTEPVVTDQEMEEEIDLNSIPF